jgi:aerobic carbon-monoxide dehydrogenase small subunit
MRTINIKVNGKPVTADIQPRTHLADFLREKLNLTGTHLGCEHGVCGACTLLVDGVPTRSCITFALACQEAEVTTIEGLDEDEITRELRAAFTREHGLQCGYCTPGMIVSARDTVLRMQDPTERDIRVAMSGNLCRCTGYVGIVRAIKQVVKDRRARGVPAIPNGNRTRLGPSGSGNAAAAAAASTVKSMSGAKLQPANRAEAVTAVAASLRDPAWRPQTAFTQSFVVAHPVDAVWDFFSNLGAVASCLPGASLAGEPVDGHVDGQIRIKVGPISAEFQGVADVTRDDVTRTGTIIGAGKDKRSNSSTRGLIGYTVKPADDHSQTKVDLNIGFTLTGTLAQFSRSGLIQDVASRIIAVFVQNLEAKLSHRNKGGTGEAAMVKEFDAGALMRSMALDYIKRAFRKLFTRK